MSDEEAAKRWEKAFGKTECRYAEEYKAIHPPRCNVDGRVCDICQEKWDERPRDPRSE